MICKHRTIKASRKIIDLPKDKYLQTLTFCRKCKRQTNVELVTL